MNIQSLLLRFMLENMGSRTINVLLQLLITKKQVVGSSLYANSLAETSVAQMSAHLSCNTEYLG